MLSAKELVKEISDKSGKDESELTKLIKEKQTELSGLVSEEGAAYIVGRELGVELIRDTKRQLKIKNVVPDMRSVNLVAKVMNVFEPRDFEKNGKKGVVASMILGDDTGTIRLPLWNEEVKLLSSLGIAQDDLVEVSGAWAKLDKRNDSAELRLGKRGKLKKLPEGEGPDLTGVKSEYAPQQSMQTKESPAQRVSIKMLKPGMNVLVKGCIVQVYRKKPYFESCPQCGSRAEEKGSKFECKDHGTVEPVYNLLLSCVIDDGTGNIRAVLFRDQAEKVFGKSAGEIKEEFAKEGLEPFWEKFAASIVGHEFMIEGRAKTNEYSKETEILANNVLEVDVKQECERLIKIVAE
jgi:replication factor A1